jgi:hypothetical protein
MTLNVGTTIKRGFAPFVTPIKFVSGFVIAAAVNGAVPEAAMLGDAATCVAAGFVTVKAKVYAVAAVRVSPV